MGQPNPWTTLCESSQPGQQWRCTQRPAVGTAHAHVYASVAAGLLRMRTPARLCNYRFRCEPRAAADNFAGQFSADYSELIRRVCTTANYNASLGTAVLFNLCAAIFAIIQRLFAAVNTQLTGILNRQSRAERQNTFDWLHILPVRVTINQYKSYSANGSRILPI